MLVQRKKSQERKHVAWRPRRICSGTWKACADGIYVFVEKAYRPRLLSDIKLSIGRFEESVLLDDGAGSGAAQMDWKASRQMRLAMQLLGGAEQRAFFW